MVFTGSVPFIVRYRFFTENLQKLFYAAKGFYITS